MAVVSEVMGFKRLHPAHQELFKKFYNNYLKQWEDDSEQHKPVKVAFRRDDNNGAYLRVDLADGSWLHVKGQHTWY